MNILLNLLLLCAVLLNGRLSDPGQKVAAGHLPVVAADASGTTHLVYGQDSTIYYTTTSGLTTLFAQPVAIAVLPDLVAGAKRGPQLAVTDQFVVITAVTRAGNVVAYSLDRKTNRWSSAVRINDVPQVAKEGFQAVAGAVHGTFHAVWLDLRTDKQNKVVGATSHDGGRSWSANQLIYGSPDGTVCECCKVSLVAKDNDVYVQFRNWLGGSRDIYLAHSTDGGKTYAPAQKLGTGTWKLMGCPMDGGGLVLSLTGQPITAWRRENTLYICQLGKTEQAIATGRNVTLSTHSAGTVVAWDEGGMIWLKRNDKVPIALGKGQMPSVAVRGQMATCVWEAAGQVMTETIGL